MKMTKEILTQVQPIADEIFGRDEKVKVRLVLIEHWFSVNLENNYDTCFALLDVEKFYNRTRHLIDYRFEWNYCYIESNLDFEIKLSFEIEKSAKTSENE